MWEFDTELSEVIQRTPSIKSFRFPIRARNVRFRSGQFFFLTIKIKGEDALHHFSFSSAPTDKGYIEFTKRITASDFSQTLNVLRPGAWAHIRGPGGDFTLNRKYYKLGFLTGGIGITPLQSMLRYIAAKKLPYDVVLLYGNRSADDIAFREELDGLAASNPNIRVEHILSGTPVPPGWKGKTGQIDQKMITALISDYRQRQFYISGPPGMVIALENQLTELGLARDQLKRDSFTGYD